MTARSAALTALLLAEASATPHRRPDVVPLAGGLVATYVLGPRIARPRGGRASRAPRTAARRRPVLGGQPAPLTRAA